MSRNFVAFDGESFTVKDKHTYVLLASSEGKYVYEKNGLSTLDCFDFILSHNGMGTGVVFGLNYDVNMILRDLPLQNIIELWHNRKTNWEGFRIEYIPSKWFSLRYKHYYIKLNEVFGFFQTSFVKALSQWGIDPQPEITELKGMRSEFTVDMRDAVISYCLNECRQLRELCNRLHTSLNSVELNPSSWVGAGSIASTLLQREKVSKHIVHDKDWPQPVRHAIMSAYFGGRSELFKAGFFPEMYDYDITSAYPYEATKLPSLKGGTWEHTTNYQPDKPYAIWRVRWDLPNKRIHPVMPFPFRRTDRNIYYPCRGEGWYHSNEVAAALDLWDMMQIAANIEILEGWVFTPANEDRPFQFIPRIYTERQKLKEQNHGGQMVLKLGMNSIYGKLAQGLGGGKTPPYQSFYWAGRVTAGCRSRILELASYDVDNLVMIATDGIFFSRPIPVKPYKGLGGIEETTGEDVFVIQPGVYSYSDGDEIITRTRGFLPKEIDWTDAREEFKTWGCTTGVRYESTRFLGMGYCLSANHMEQWRTWNTHERKLNFYPQRKFVWDEDERPVRFKPPAMVVGEASVPYEPKSDVPVSPQEVQEMLGYIQDSEQPLRAY